MRYRIRNELKNADYVQLTGLLNENKCASIELLPSVDLEFISVSHFVVTSDYQGRFSVNGKVSFQQSIGLEVYKNIKLDDEMQGSLTVDSRNVKFTKVVQDTSELESYLNKCFMMLERIVNYACIMFNVQVEQSFTLNYEWLDKQLNVILKREELVKRGEIPRPFGTIHAKGSKDAQERAGDLIPLYKEHDKTYLYDSKRVYFLLSRNFVANLLRCDEATMVREEEFDKRGKEVLRDLVYKKRLRKHETLGGITCYYGLNEKTRRYLTKLLGHKTSRHSISESPIA